ncbi:MAG: phage tail sheath family protein [Proteobacteria bacterium]|nr:phage tail sheath family protein [Burkholderiales bacterium]
MPSAPIYPGVYIEETPGGVRAIAGVATAVTAFVGSALRGPLDSSVDAPVRVQGFSGFVQVFGGLAHAHPMSYAIEQFFQNGGAEALVVRVANAGAAATGAADTLNLAAATPGAWGNNLRVRVDHLTRPEMGNEQLFNLSVRDTDTGATERFMNVSVLDTHSRFVGTVLDYESQLVRLVAPAPADKPDATPDATDTEEGVDPLTVTPGSLAFNADGDDGATITDAQVSDPALKAAQQGLWALARADMFNLLCVPPFALDDTGDVGAQTRSAAADYARARRALYLVDPLIAWEEPADLLSGAASVDSATWGLERSENAALYFPRLRSPDALQQGALAAFAPCGAVAGVYARTDAQRGVWKAPAGTDASLTGVAELTVRLTDAQNGLLNPAGVNCLRAFPQIGRVVWGARTLRGSDALASEWKYVPVRRLALYIEESLLRGTQWVVFEPNDEPLWAQIRLCLDAFMHDLFVQGAFQGRSPREAYFVMCDRETTTHNDVDLGVVNLLVGFAPLKPAEFVVIRLQQRAGQCAA